MQPPTCSIQVRVQEPCRCWMLPARVAPLAERFLASLNTLNLVSGLVCGASAPLVSACLQLPRRELLH